MLTEIVLEPDTRFMVVMIGQDEKRPGVTKIVLDVKETAPTLESELVKFKSFCEEPDKEIEEDLANPLKMRGGLVLGGFDQERSSISYNFDINDKDDTPFNCEERGEFN